MLRRARVPGFTLIEVMITVAIIGVLGTLAVYGVRNYVDAAKTSEAMEVIRGIKIAQESYKDETFTYLDISDDLEDLYPIKKADLGDHKVAWGADADDLDDKWRKLGVAPSAPVQFGFACVAGAAGETVSGVPANLNYPTTPSAPWYVIKAMGDRDDDDIFAVLYASSFTDEIYVENDTE